MDFSALDLSVLHKEIWKVRRIINYICGFTLAC